jgi:TetR/AcrR family transcriptional repressor of nem operon
MPRPLEFNRDHALDQAITVFLNKGYEATSIDDLTSALGISRASLYNSFTDKHGLLLAALDRAILQTDSIRANLCAGSECARAVIERFFKLLLDRAAASAQGCILLTLGAELAATDPQVRIRIQQSLDASRAMFARLLRAERRFTPAQVQDKAACLVGAMVGLLTLARLHPDRRLRNANLRRALAILD